MSGQDTNSIQYTVRDRPAERNTAITNILLTILTLGGGVFGTVVTSSISDMQNTVKDIQGVMVASQVTNGIVVNDIEHIKRAMSKCQEFHDKVETRLDALEHKKL